VLRGLLDQCDRDRTVVRRNVLQGCPARRLYERHGFSCETEDPVDVFMLREPAFEFGQGRIRRGSSDVGVTGSPGRRRL
jgi:hypothetical protein